MNDFERLWLKDKNVDEVVATISSFSASKLDIGMNNLERFNGHELALCLNAIPPHVHSLKMRGNDLGKLSGTELAQAFAAIPPSVTYLDFSDNLDIKSGAKLAQAFASLPPSVHTLKIDENVLGHKSKEELIQIFSAIPSTVKSLNIEKNSLYLHTAEDLKQILSAIPSTVTSININGNALYKKSPEEISQILAPLSSVTEFELIGEDSDLTSMLSMLPPTIISLRLSAFFGLFDDVVNKMAAIPSSITHITCLLSSKAFNWYENNKFDVIANIPLSVTSLRLDIDGLIYKIGEDNWALLCNAIPPTVKTLDLSKNSIFDDKTTPELLQFLASIPKTVTMIKLNHNNLFDRKSVRERDELLKGLEPYLKENRIDISYNGESDFARAIVPVSQLTKQKRLPAELGAKILNYTLSKTNDESRATVLNQQTLEVIRVRHSIIEVMDEHLKIFENKAQEFNQRGTKSWRALESTKHLIKDIKKEKKNFLEANHNKQDKFQKAKDSLLINCKKIIAKANEELKNHRGFKELFAQFLSALVSVLSLGIMNYRTGKSALGLFPVATDSSEKLENFENDLIKKLT